MFISVDKEFMFTEPLNHLTFFGKIYQFPFLLEWRTQVKLMLSLYSFLEQFLVSTSDLTVPKKLLTKMLKERVDQKLMSSDFSQPSCLSLWSVWIYSCPRSLDIWVLLRSMTHTQITTFQWLPNSHLPSSLIQEFSQFSSIYKKKTGSPILDLQLMSFIICFSLPSFLLFFIW